MRCGNCSILVLKIVTDSLYVSRLFDISSSILLILSWKFWILYKLRTRRLNKLNKYRDNWYTEDGKKYPVDNINLTPTILKMWYVGDGSLSSNLNFQPNMDINGKYRFSLEGSKKFWSYIGGYRS